MTQETHPDYAALWTERYGEALTVTAAAKLLGTSRTTIYGFLDEGGIDRGRDGRILTRSLANWYTQPKRPKERRIRAASACRWHVG